MRQQKGGMPYELQEASSKEASFLRKLSGAKDDYDWIIANEAWLKLGFETFTDWYTTRVQPVLLALGARPLPEIAADVIERVRADDEVLPKAQRHTQKELAAIAGVHPDTLSGRKRQDRDEAEVPPLADLDNPDSPAGQPPEPDVPEDSSMVATDGQPETDASVEHGPRIAPDVAPQPDEEAGSGKPEEGQPARRPSSGDKAERSEALANWAKENSEGAATERRSRIYRWLATQTAMVEGYGPAELDDLLDNELVEAIARFGDQVTEWVQGVEAAYGKSSKLRLVKGA